MTNPAANGGYHPVGVGTLADGAAGETPRWRYTLEDGACVEVTILAEDLARVQLLPAGVAPAASWAVIRDDWPAVPVRQDVGENGVLRLTTDAMRIEVDTNSLRLRWSWPDGAPFAEDDPALGMGVYAAPAAGDIPEAAFPAGSVRCAKRLAPGERILGAGEHTAPLDRRGQHLVFWNTDPAQPHRPETGSMYAAIPFWMGLRAGRAYGIFLDSVWRTDLDAGASHPERLSFGAAGGDLTYYVFAGPTPAAILSRYATLTGAMPLPPKWALGYGQSRWSYFPEESLREVAAQLRAARIPCDSLWLDIDYMDGYRVFTVSPRRFPDFAGTLRDLSEQGFKVVTILDPGVKADPTDETFTEDAARDYFVRRADGSLFTGVVWPGESAFPDFSRAEVRRWWGERHRALLDAGVAGIWDDMNEPALTDFLAPGGSGGASASTHMPLDAIHRPDGPDGPALPHAAFHNAYGMQMARATYDGLRALRPDRRPFVLTRSGYAGIQRYAAMWTGDNVSAWEHLRLAARMCLALGLSGVPFVGFDTGGFWGDASAELLVRFTQLGAVFPFFRNHSARDTVAQEPWAFGQPYTAFCRDAIELRYRLLPYLYTAFAEAARTGAPIARPLVFAYPDAETLAAVEDEHLLGPDLLCAPVLTEGVLGRVVEFPRGAWVDWHTGRRFAGPLRA
ncbi:MAG: TIM-barrel domain-containing protein, partial [Ktedonobacterales bacterium]